MLLNQPSYAICRLVLLRAALLSYQSATGFDQALHVLQFLMSFTSAPNLPGEVDQGLNQFIHALELDFHVPRQPASAANRFEGVTCQTPAKRRAHGPCG